METEHRARSGAIAHLLAAELLVVAEEQQTRAARHEALLQQVLDGLEVAQHRLPRSAEIGEGAEAGQPPRHRIPRSGRDRGADPARSGPTTDLLVVDRAPAPHAALVHAA